MLPSPNNKINNKHMIMAAPQEQVANKVEDQPPPPPPPPEVEVEVENKPPPVPVPVPVPVPQDKPPLVVVEKSPDHEEDKPTVKRDVVLARVATEKKDALIKAWEESERSKVDNRTQKKLAAIGAWENSKKAELEAELKKIEENLDMKKAKCTEKMKNKIALLHKKAEEKRAVTQAKRGQDLLKAEEAASKCRATGSAPKKLLRWFSK